MKLPFSRKESDFKNLRVKCKKYKFSEFDGITLVSLVITIIILIILSSIAISFTIGNNGIITRAKEAKKMQIIANAKEQIGIEIITAQTEAIERNEEIEQSQIEVIISKYGSLQEDKDTIILKDNNYKISLKEIYNGEISNTGSYEENKILYQVTGAIYNNESQIVPNGQIMMPNTEKIVGISGGKSIASFISNKLKLEENSKLTLPKGKYIFESYVPVRLSAHGVGYKIINSNGITIVDHTADTTTNNLYSSNFELEETTDISIYWYRTNRGWTDLTYYKIIEM